MLALKEFHKFLDAYNSVEEINAYIPICNVEHLELKTVHFCSKTHSWKRYEIVVAFQQMRDTSQDNRFKGNLLGYTSKLAAYGLFEL